MKEITFKVTSFFGFDFDYIVDGEIDNHLSLKINDEQAEELIKLKKELGRKWLTRKRLEEAVGSTHPELKPTLESIDENLRQLYLIKWLAGLEYWDEEYEGHFRKDVESGLYNIDEAVGLFVYETLCGCDDEVAEKHKTKEGILESSNFINWNKYRYYEWVDEHEDLYFRAERYGFDLEDLDLEYLNYRIRID